MKSWLGTATLLSLALSCPLNAQSRFVIRGASGAWRTVETAHWIIHYPESAAAFASCLVPRLEPIYAATSAVVGYVTETRVRLVIEDAMSFSGGFASANARDPVIVLQTQPSSPASGGYSDCATARMVHELTHILQLSRPWTSDHPLWARAAISLLPAEPGPIVFRRKPWLRESYAEHVEGVLTPTGAPYTTSRANAVRLLALADALPAYTDLDASEVGQYLVGAAFVDWMVRESGEDAFRKLWRRMASPRWAGDSSEFTVLFGAAPAILYARFAELAKANSQKVRARFEAAGLVRGERVRTIGNSDAVAVSPDGRLIAAVVGSSLLRLHLWRAGDTVSAAEQLPVPTGQSPSAPRFTRDGKRLLSIQWEMKRGGYWRPDVYEWDLSARSFRRITRGASVREVDPFPSGRQAAGVRCDFGICDLVTVDLATGTVAVLSAGAHDRAFYRPRVSLDGSLVAVAVQTGFSSRIAIVDVTEGALRYVDPDDGIWRYEPAWLPDGRLVVVSEATGIPNLEILDPTTRRTTALTRMLAPATAPEYDGADGVYFIRRAPNGSELRHIRLADAAITTVVVRDSAYWPATPVRLPAPAPRLFDADPVPPSRDYGLGSRFYSVVPGLAWSAEGASGSVHLWTSDIVGKLSAMAGVTVASNSAWHGGNVAVAWRGSTLPLLLDAAVSSQTVFEYRGATARTQLEWGAWARRQRMELGLSAGSISGSQRAFAAADYATAISQVSDRYATETIRIGAAIGSSAGQRWARSSVAATIEIGRTNVAHHFTLAGQAGLISANAPAFEQWSVGGIGPPTGETFSLSQRIAQPLSAVSAPGRLMGTVRLTGRRMGPVSPFVWTGGTGTALDRWTTVVGAGRAFSDDPRRNWHVPGARLSVGAGYAVTGAIGLRAYVSLAFAQ